ncbi:TIGR03618 family F420-dependent PPOX class oxidoreductase [Pseudonocardia cypriaca]|uniref:PPOX class probable F420-dependent enzyme n=1 Tax=Pseudonocardia cypriaca TaxID=882449 RepID=A0A543FYY0_9PSEU|nr:TIGR03618 family F420-dependent PPOX class oxidoreductase [Pseudonocardia cypriaca]TQM38964.1 PPOX class probable F420-dependent enzyme [Pseudonocardia cypriaca]
MSSKRFVVTGGTDGMGRAVALDRLRRGDEVAIVGRNADKGAAFLDLAARDGAAGRAHFVHADLGLVAGTRAAIREVRSLFPAVDALVLCARHYRSTRAVTAEGVESNFALFYLSRHVMSYEMTDLLDAADSPIIVNVAGPGARTPRVRWHDLELEHGYDGTTAMMHGGPLNDLLGVGYADEAPSRKVRYALLNPGTVSTSFSGEYDVTTAAQIDAIRATATPVEEGIRPILALLDRPPAEPVSAWVRHEPLPLTGPNFDVAAARRLRTETRRLLAALPRGGRRPYVVSGVSAERLREVLDSPIFATVATIQPDGTPQQSVVWVERDGDDVLFMVGIGSRKERNIRRDPRVSVLVCPPDAPYGYAAIRGRAVFEPALSERLRDDLTKKYVGVPYAEHVARTPEAEAGDVIAVRLVPERTAGRL